MFSHELRRLRKAQGWTQAELAQLLEISPSAVGMYEQGRREPDTSLLARLAALFHVSVGALLGVAEEGSEVNDVIDTFTRTLETQRGLMFNGAPLTEEDREKLVHAIRVAAAISSPKNKERK